MTNLWLAMSIGALFGIGVGFVIVNEALRWRMWRHLKRERSEGEEE